MESLVPPELRPQILAALENERKNKNMDTKNNAKKQQQQIPMKKERRKYGSGKHEVKKPKKDFHLLGLSTSCVFPEEEMNTKEKERELLTRTVFKRPKLDFTRETRYLYFNECEKQQTSEPTFTDDHSWLKHEVQVRYYHPSCHKEQYDFFNTRLEYDGNHFQAFSTSDSTPIPLMLQHLWMELFRHGFAFELPGFLLCFLYFVLY